MALCYKRLQISEKWPHIFRLHSSTLSFSLDPFYPHSTFSQILSYKASFADIHLPWVYVRSAVGNLFPRKCGSLRQGGRVDNSRLMTNPERSNGELNLQKIIQVCLRVLPGECCQSRLEELPIPQERYWEVRGWGRLRRQRFKTAISDCMSCPSQLFEAIEKHTFLDIF